MNENIISSDQLNPFIVHLQIILHLLFSFCAIPREQCSKKRLFGANYSQHVLYTPFNELDWRRGHRL